MTAEQEAEGPSGQPLLDPMLQQRIQQAVEPFMATFRQQVTEIVQRQLEQVGQPGAAMDPPVAVETNTPPTSRSREHRPAQQGAHRDEDEDTQHQEQAAAPPIAHQAAPTAVQPTNLADLLERVLDKGIVIAGDITLSLGTIELLTLRIRLLIASVDKAQEIGIDWWKSDPALSSQAKKQRLEERIERLEAMLGGDGQSGETERGQSLETEALPDQQPPGQAGRAPRAPGGETRNTGRWGSGA